MKLGLKAWEAITHLRGNPDFRIFVEAIADHTSSSNERLIKASQGDEHLRGQVYALSTLLEEINTAREKFEKAQGPKS